MSITTTLRSLRRAGVSVPLALVGLAATAFVAMPNSDSPEARLADAECPPGYQRLSEVPETLQVAYARGKDLNGPAADATCVTQKLPEPFAEVEQRQIEAAQAQFAPYSAVQPGAQRAALEERLALEASGRSLPGTAGKFEPYGHSALQSNDDRFGPSGLGIIDANGRVDDMEYYPEQGLLLAAVGSGGIWLSRDNAATWEDVGVNLPTQSTGGGVAYTTAHGGRLLVLTGDGSFGGIAARNGVGVLYSDDMGATWNFASGVPDLALGFAIEVDPTDPMKVYAATFKGLFVSRDGGTSFVNANLPTGDCAGVTDTVARPECHLANVVTDVVVQAPGGSTDAAGGKVMAAVGWRNGQHEYPNGGVESPNNGLYYSETGDADTFSKLAAGGFTPQHRIGRVELGTTIGPDQNHEILYAIVQDAVLLAGGSFVDNLDDPAAGGTVLEGLYASMDFGQSWTQLTSGEELVSNQGSGSALNGVGTALGVAPGVQAWYNLFIHPDPTRHQGGVPTRLVFGLEEVWQNEANLPQNQKQSYKVIGRYFSGETCMLLSLGTPVCPTQRGAQLGSTTHPDQHTAVWVPDGEGGVTLHVGNDGGVYSAFAAEGEEYDNSQWGASNTVGMNTLLPYDATIAADGVEYAGYQDNGTSLREYDGFAHMWNGGDGFFVGVDPDDSCRAYGESQNAGLRATVDCGLNSNGMAPPITNVRFSTPFEVDPLDANHIVVVGREVVESLGGPGTSGADWAEVFDTGTASRPGDPDAPSDDPNDPEGQVTGIDVYGDAVYAGFCAPCDILNSPHPFTNGLATNVGGDLPPRATTTDGWHVATAAGLPNRFITSIAIDRANPEKVYVALGGYSRRWYGPGTKNDVNDQVGEGHLFLSTDAGETFTDVSGNLPDTPIYWVETRGDQVIVGTEFGTFLTASSGGTEFIPLPGERPAAPISTLEIQPSDPDKLVIATFGRGTYTYTFDDKTVGPDVERVHGRSRVETAVAISQEMWNRADTVVIARADNYADALTGAPLARKLDAPILLSASATLSPEAAAEVSRLGARTAIVLGGPNALAPAVEDGLRAAGATTIRRYAGTDRFGTAQAIAAQLGDRSGKAYLVKGFDEDPAKGWPDALAVAPLAAFQGRPVLLTQTAELTGTTAETMAQRGITDVTIVGGEGVVAPEVADAVAGSGASVSRIAGENRYHTSSLVAEAALAAGMGTERFWFATGDNYPDALAAGPAAAKDGQILVLVDTFNIRGASTQSRDWVKAHRSATSLVRLVGGYKALAQATEIQSRSIWTREDKPPLPALPEAPEGTELARYSWDVDAEGWTVRTVGFGDTADAPKQGWARQCNGNPAGIAFCVQPYTDETVTALVSPAIPTDGGPMFFQWDYTMQTEDGFDFFGVDVSTDGVRWTNLFTDTGHNDSGFGLFDTLSMPFHTGRYVQGSDGKYTWVDGPTDVYLRFRMSSDQLVFDAGVAVDNPVLLR